MNAAEYLARIGFGHLLGAFSVPVADEDDQEEIANAQHKEHRFVLMKLLAVKPSEPARGRGCRWLVNITWPNRVPGLIVWSGQQSLKKVIEQRQEMLRSHEFCEGDLYLLTVSHETTCGIDSWSCADPIDIGFNPRVHKMLIAQRPALELLAIIGLETVPLVSFGYRDCGFIHGRSLCRFAVTCRDGGYYHRWGDVRTEPLH